MASLGRHVKRTAQRAATSATDGAAVAPGSRAASAIAFALASWTTRATPALARLVAIGIPIVPSPMNPTCSLMVTLQEKARRSVGSAGRSAAGASWRGLHRRPNRVADAGHEQRRALAGVYQEGRELLHGHPPEPRTKRAAPHAAEEQLALGLERTGVERLAVVAGEAQLGALKMAVGHLQAQPLHHERGVGGLEPVPLALAEGEAAPVVGARHHAEEEAQHRGVDDLGAVVIDAPVAIDLIAVLARRLPAHAVTGTDGWRETRRRSSAWASAGRPPRRYAASSVCSKRSRCAQLPPTRTS